MNIAGVLILYHPDLQQLSANIKSYVTGLKQLYIYDNSELQIFGIESQILSIDPCIKYQYFNTNQGIAKRLNQAVDQAILEGYDYLLTMDQDSSFKPGDFEKYTLNIHSGSYTHIAQFGVNSQPKITLSTPQPHQALTLITSGSILNLNLIKKIGPFNEKLFIDFVDTEFSYRVIQKGYVNLMFSDILLNHALGKLIEGRSLLTFKKSLRIIHSPIRVFYITRNGLYLLFNFKGINKEIKNDIIRSMKIIKNDLIYHPKLGEVYLNFVKGFVAFCFNKMGKY